MHGTGGSRAAASAPALAALSTFTARAGAIASAMTWWLIAHVDIGGVGRSRPQAPPACTARSKRLCPPAARDNASQRARACSRICMKSSTCCCTAAVCSRARFTRLASAASPPLPASARVTGRATRMSALSHGCASACGAVRRCVGSRASSLRMRSCSPGFVVCQSLSPCGRDALNQLQFRALVLLTCSRCPRRHAA